MKARGTPIDGLGIQGHVYELPRDKITPEALQELAERAQQLGLEISVTELDVTGDDADDQRDQYVSVLKTCPQLANCFNLTTWGLEDAYGSTYGFGNNVFKPGNALIYTNGRPKKTTRDALVQALSA